MASFLSKHIVQELLHRTKNRGHRNSAITSCGWNNTHTNNTFQLPVTQTIPTFQDN